MSNKSLNNAYYYLLSLIIATRFMTSHSLYWQFAVLLSKLYSSRIAQSL